jgi:hypothetical protein
MMWWKEAVSCWSGGGVCLVHPSGREKLAVALNLSDNPANLPAPFPGHKDLLSDY